MKIVDIQTHLLSTRWNDDPGFPDAYHSTAILRIQTDGGYEGFGECTLGYFAPEAVGPMVEYFKPVLVGGNPECIATITKEMYDNAAFWARTGAGRSVISGLEIALCDLFGKILNVPVYQLLGGAARDRIPVYASGGPTLWPIEQNIPKVDFYLQQGFRAAKLSTHLYQICPSTELTLPRRLVQAPLSHWAEVDKLVELFTALRKQFGPDVGLAIDGHEGATPNPISACQALDFATALAPFHLNFYEEPLAYTDLDGYQSLCQKTPIPIAGGESLCGLNEFHTFVARQGLHFMQPDIGYCGGIAESLRIINHGRAFNAPTLIHTGGSIGPALAAAWHIAAASDMVKWLELIVASRSAQCRLLADDWSVVEGTIGLPTSAGLGVRMSSEILEQFRYIPGSEQRT